MISVFIKTQNSVLCMLISLNNEGKLEGLIFTLIKFFVKAAMS